MSSASLSATTGRRGTNQTVIQFPFSPLIPAKFPVAQCPASRLFASMPPTLHPKDIQIIGSELAIKWSDDTEDFYPMERLRALSPSAENMGEQDLLGNTYGGDSRERFPGARVTGWQQIGGYALLLRFSDGHKTGIYSYAYLKKISEG